MSAVVDLQLQQQQADGPLTVFVVTPSARENAVVEPPAEALEWQAEWRRQFLAFHDPAAAAVSADAVRDFSAGLCRALAAWLEQSSCSRLREVLLEHPELPVRLRIDGEGSAAGWLADACAASACRHAAGPTAPPTLHMRVARR